MSLLRGRCATKFIKTYVEPIVDLLMNSMVSTNFILKFRNMMIYIQIIIEKERNSYLSQICLGEQFSSKALVSVAVPYSSVPQM